MSFLPPLSVGPRQPEASCRSGIGTKYPLRRPAVSSRENRFGLWVLRPGSGLWSRFLVVGLLGAALGCGGVEPLGVRYSSADLTSLAHRRELTRAVDAGTSEARSAMLAGWSVDEQWGAQSVVWSQGGSSVLGFYAHATRDSRLRFFCSPFPSTTHPAQSVAFRLNGTEVAQVTLEEEFREGEVLLPKASLREGFNQLELVYGWTDRAPPDPRNFAVAWDWLAFETGISAAAGSSEPASEGQDQLTLGSDSWQEIVVELAPGDLLTWDQAFAAAPGETLSGAERLSVVLQTETDLKELALELAGGGRQSVSLPIGHAGPVRLLLGVLPGEEASRQSATVTLLHPRIEATGAAPSKAPRSSTAERLPVRRLEVAWRRNSPLPSQNEDDESETPLRLRSLG